MTVWRQTSINITFLFKSCLKTYCSPLPAFLCFSHPLPWVLACLFWFNSLVASRLIRSVYGGILLIIQVMRWRERRTNTFAQSCSEASSWKAPSPRFPGWHPPFSYASPSSDLLSLDLWSLGFKIPTATTELFIFLLHFLLQPQLEGGLWRLSNSEVSFKIRKLLKRGET